MQPFWLCQANMASKASRSYNGNGPPARMQIFLSPGRETESLFGV